MPKEHSTDSNWPKQIPGEIVDLLLEEIESNPQACRTTDEIPYAKGPFGLTPSNPIPVFGIPSNEIYLGRLRTKQGRLLRWKRICSLHDDNVEKPIDKYEIFDEEGNSITFLYLSPYHWRTSMKAPSGFKLVE